MSEKTSANSPEINPSDHLSAEQKLPPNDTTEKKEHIELVSGEQVFTIILCLTGLVAFLLSLNLLAKVKAPKISSAAAVPLFVSFLWTLLSFIMILENIKKKSPLSSLKGTKEKFKAAVEYVMPFTVFMIAAFCICYCVLMFFGLSFYIATPVFLWGSMCYLKKGHFIKNILWTAIVMAFIIVVFRIVFGVVFP
ncbi:tripartite tricarboxylate transporter TctB family protein [Hominifimenecus sp. rT4P-3]|uniref:tripartite tricarboxylate transporter TctB family protein n=1 Tax=Hominifimenecus sp. rT4P-3 TaxID=3242979 RepID=UPI003DA43E37